MRIEPNIAPVASLFGEPSRAAILTALLDGRALPAGELARVAGLAPTAASGHLAKLTSGKLERVMNFFADKAVQFYYDRALRLGWDKKHETGGAVTRAM